MSFIFKLIKLSIIILIYSILNIFLLYYLYPIFNSNNISLNFGIHTINIYPSQPLLWTYMKNLFIISYIISYIIIIFPIYKKLILSIINNKKFQLKKTSETKNIELKLLIGNNFFTNEPVYIYDKGLYQNILITGTIGTGKTSSAMYPFTRQLMSYYSKSVDKKIGMLILDVKGNYYSKVLEYAKEFNREDDIIVIELNGKYKYNPLDKPSLKPSVIANQLKNILLLFSPNNSESYWIDKSEAIITEAIKLCRLYNFGYVSFSELHKLITQEQYYFEKIEYLKSLFLNNKLSKLDLFDLLSCINFFNKEFFSLDSRTLNILKSEITRITNCFISDYETENTFCPKKEELNFNGFSDVVDYGKIVVLNMNINEYRNLSKIIAAYLKMDFQTEVMSRLSNNNFPSRTTAFISDEYSEYVTSLDANFFSQSREAKCINIISTQSYTSLLNTLNNQYTVKVITQNLVNKLWYRSDDIFTIEDAQKQIGKSEQQRQSKTISENAKETIYSYFTNSFNSKNSSISESINNYSQLDYTYDTNFFTQNLETFTSLSFLSDGTKILPPCKLKMLPYFKKI